MVPKPVKRKPEDELRLPNIAVKKAKASSAVDGDYGDNDERDYSDEEISPQNLRRRWLEDSIPLLSSSLSEGSGEHLVEEVEEAEQSESDTNEEDEKYLDSELHFKGQSIGIPRDSKQPWESNKFFDPNIDIYPLNAAVQLQNDLEILESELVIRDKIPWESFKRELCRHCEPIVDKHLQAVNRRQPENSNSDECDGEIRPSLGTRGGFDYFLGLPTLEELANKQRDIETLRILRPIGQEFALDKLEPKLCENCDKHLRTSGKLPAKTRATASLVHVPAEQSRQKPNVEKPAPTSGPESQPPVPIGPPKIQPRAPRPAPESVPELKQPSVPIDPPQKVPAKIAPPKQVTTKQALTPQQFAPDEPQPPAQADRPKRKGPAPKSVAPEEPQPAVQAGRPKRKGSAPKAVVPEEPQPSAPVAPGKPQPPAQAETPKRKGPAPKAVAPEEPQVYVPVAPEKPQPSVQAEKPKRKGPAPKAVAPEEPQIPVPVAPEKPQPPAQAERPKRKGPASKAVAPEEPQPPVQNERPKRKGPAPKAVAPEEPQPPEPDGKPKKKDPTPGPIAPKEAEPINPTAAAEKARKKPGRAGKTNVPNPPPASPKPATQEVDKVEDEEAGPIQQVMGNLPEKLKGHEYYCAICYTNLTRMGSAKKLEHMEKCGTTLGEVKVMTKAQAQAEKAAK